MTGVQTCALPIYAIQGGAASFVERIDGSYTNVVGLPTCELVRLLRSLGVDGGGK